MQILYKTKTLGLYSKLRYTIQLLALAFDECCTGTAHILYTATEKSVIEWCRVQISAYLANIVQYQRCQKKVVA